MAQAEVAVSKPDLAKQLYGPIAGNRWVQLVAGIVGMIVISNYQYAFTLFTPGMKEQFAGVPYKDIAAIFSLFIVFETWPVPVAGVLIDKFGIRRLMIIGSIGVCAGWVLGGTVATSVFHLYIFYGVIAGTSAGIIYIATVANAVKWFPDKRGLAAGLTAAGFGGGAALTVIPISATINSIGWAHAMAVLGVAQGAIAIVAALVLHHPPDGWSPPGWKSHAGKASQKVVQSRVEYHWTETLKRPEFYLMYVMFLCVATGGLMTTGNLKQIAKSLHVDATIWGIGAVTFALTLAGVSNALSRIMWGALSDRFGREHTMAFAFALEAALIFLVTRITGYPLLFVVLMPFVFLAWGEIFALFSALTGDVFGPKNATANYGMLYTAKGLSAILAGYGAAAVAAAYAGSFLVPFYIAASFDILAAVLAVVFLRPLVRSRIAAEGTREVPTMETGPSEVPTAVTRQSF